MAEVSKTPPQGEPPQGEPSQGEPPQGEPPQGETPQGETPQEDPRTEENNKELSPVVPPDDSQLNLMAILKSIFPTLGGILFGYDAGYIAGVLAMDQFKLTFGSPGSANQDGYFFKGQNYMYSTGQKALITSILSAGTFVGALIAGYFCDKLGRRSTIVAGGLVYMAGVAMQTASESVNVLVGGRAVAGLGVGIVNSAVVLYTSEITAKKIRGTIMSCYQWAITIGLLISAGVNQGTKDINSSAAYRIPIGLQFAWALILVVGVLFMPESPRWYVMKERTDDARNALCRLRSQEPDSPPITRILTDLKQNHDDEQAAGAGAGSWADCFRGGWKCGSNLQLTLLGIGIQAMQQLIGVNFIFYYGTTFFKRAGIANPFLITLITNIVNVVSTPIAFYAIDRQGRRALLLWGAAIMSITQFIIAIVSSATSNEPGGASQIVLIVFTCVFINMFAWTWGPTGWTVIGEIFPLPIRARGVGLATASNWLVNFAIAFSTPYVVDEQYGNLGGRVFFIWGSTCALAWFFAYFCVWETKKLSLEQANEMVVAVKPQNSVAYNQRITKPTADVEMLPGGISSKPPAKTSKTSEVEVQSQRSEEKRQRNGVFAKLRGNKKSEAPLRTSSSGS